MSINLHRMQVEITAEINKFKQKCDAVKAVSYTHLDVYKRQS